MKDHIPEYPSEEEEAKFWDTHDSTDFQSELKKDRLTKFVQRRKPAGAMKYCLGCSYCLEGLSEHRCPECGRLFEPGDQRTFTTTPWTKRTDWYGLALVAFALGGLSALAYGIASRPIFGRAFAIGCASEGAVVIGGLVGLIFSRVRPKRVIGFAFLLVGIFLAIVVTLFVMMLQSLRGFRPFF